MYDFLHIAIEAISAITCMVLIRFMIIPYRFTRERRYIGLPLGFGILGLSYIFTIALWIPQFSSAPLAWLAHLTRVFAFTFIAITYYFSKEPSKKSRLLWDLTLSLMIILLITSSLLIFAPQNILAYNAQPVLILRILSLIFLFYIVVHTIRQHIINPKVTKMWIPLGFILLTISQISLLLTQFTSGYGSIWGWSGLAVRLASLAVFLIVSYDTVYIKGKKHKV